MGLANYTQLKESVANWSHRDDIDLLMDDFIDIAETEMFNNDTEILKVREMQIESTASVSTVNFALPDRFLEMRSLRLDVNSGGDLRFKSANDLYRRSGTGQPRYFTVKSQVEFDVTPDQTYTVEMIYFQRPQGLSSSNTTNDILTNYPNIYLWGCLWAAFTYADDEAQAQKYYARFINQVQGANRADKQGRFGPAPYARVKGATP